MLFVINCQSHYNKKGFSFHQFNDKNWVYNIFSCILVSYEFLHT